MKKGCAWMLGLVVAGAFFGFVASAAWTYVMPKMYESEVIIEVKQRPLSVPTSRAQPMTPQFFATEFEKIKSRKALEKVIEKLSLTQRWNVDKEDAIRNLKGMVITQNIRGTDLISIRVRHSNSEEAREIVEAVVNSYRDYRNEIEKKHEEAVLLELNKAVRDQEGKVEEKRKALEAVIRANHRDNMTGNAPDGQVSREEAIQRGLDAQDYVDAKRECETDQELLQELKLKKVSADVGSRIPFQSVEIHDAPTAAQMPVSPNVTLNLVLGTVAGAIVFPFAGLLVMGVMRIARGNARAGER